MSYPASLEDFFAKKEGLLTQQSPGPSASKEKEAEKSEKKKTPRKRESLVVKQELESRATSPVLRSASPCTSCPLCSRSFPLEVNLNIIHKFNGIFCSTGISRNLRSTQPGAVALKRRRSQLPTAQYATWNFR